ncbi:hypothetical protein HK097_003984 [Rhizophlyctis rosea]|uniref:DUF7789 domain-containing protein n=1 Tax=Rhizophlyctis rosea TaxID=64517 RepID=A0AAD5X2W1_9FUNG|nr:hypothetical protein HK097_003984 [Rhizophlyctis rosea]
MIPTTKYGRLTLFAVLIEAIIVIILESVVAAIFWKYFDVNEKGPARGVPVYLIIFIIAQLFQIVLCWDAVWHKNTIQIMGFVLFNFSVCLYSGFQYSQMNGLLNPSASSVSTGAPAIVESDKNLLKSVLMAIPIIVAVFTVLFAFFAFKLYLEFGWKIYKKIGADPKMRNMYRVYQIFIMLLKLDIFFVFGFGIQFLVLVINNKDPEFALTVAALPITMAFLIFAVYGVRREDKLIMTLFCAGLLLAIAYFIFKLARIWQRKNDDKYMDTKNYLTFFVMTKTQNAEELNSAPPARKPLEE